MLDNDFGGAEEDPPLDLLAGAVLGILGTVLGLLWLVLSVALAVPGSITLQLLFVVGGFVLFVASMLSWSPELER